MNPYLAGSKPQFLTSPSNAQRKIQTPQKLILPSIQNNTNSRSSISFKNAPGFNAGSPRSNLIDYGSLSASNPFQQNSRIISDAYIKSDAALETRRFPESALLQSPKSRIQNIYQSQSPLLNKNFSRKNSIDLQESISNLDKRMAATEESPTTRRKDSVDYADNLKYNSLGDSLEALSRQETCNTSRVGANSARSPHDEIVIRPKDSKVSPKKNSKKLVTLDGKMKIEKTFHSLETSPKMSINMPGMSLKAVFLKDKAIQGSSETSEEGKEKFTGRSMNRSLTEQIAHKQRERALLQDLGIASPRLPSDTVKQSLLERLKVAGDNKKEFPVTFTPIRIKKESPEPSSLPKIASTERQSEKGLTLAEYFSQEEEKRKQQRTVHETVADKVIEEESESNMSILQEDRAELESQGLHAIWPQRGNTFKKKTKQMF